MNVYINKSFPSYGSGLIIVAANSIDEAHELAINHSDFIRIMKIYPYKNWELAEDLVYNGTEPKVIEENNYME